MNIYVSPSVLDIASLQSAIPRDDSVGAVASFTGLMRNVNEGQAVTAMFLDHYAGMTESVLSGLVAKAQARWPISSGVLAHRVGAVEVGDILVYVEVRTMHRQDAFDACNFIMDMLKTEAPFWKKELTDKGERWVDARQSDTDALSKW